jgi:hypothetical protein
MTTQEIITHMEGEADKLTAAMDAIFAPYKDLVQAPEFMPEGETVKWDILYVQRREILQGLDRIRSIAEGLYRFYMAELF